jgi:hypothetical protein
VIRTILRDAGLGLGAVYLAVCVIVIAVAAIGDLFGKDYDRRSDDR